MVFDPPGISQPRADGRYSPLSPTPSLASSIPAGLNWDQSKLPLSSILLPAVAGRAASASVAATALFDSYSTARSAPAVTYYVNGGGAQTVNGVAWGAGADTNAGTSAALPLATMAKATVLGNAVASPCLVNVLAGLYPRQGMPSFTTSPAVDLAWVAIGGRVIVGSFDLFSAPSRDATFTNTYSYAVTNVARVFDYTNLNRFGDYTELVQVSTAALCNTTPNSWALLAGTLYINRSDQAAVTNQNTRVYRTSSNIMSISTPLSVYLAGQNVGDGFDFEGGSSHCLNYVLGSPTSTLRAVVALDGSFKYSGGLGNQSRNFTVDGLCGAVLALRCHASASMTDGFNAHNTPGSGRMMFATVNCSGYDNGRVPNSSCNGWTTHDDVTGIDVGGDYRANRGGTVASVGAAKALLSGTYIERDLGDLTMAVGNTNAPCAVYTRDTAEYWCDRVVVDMPAGTWAFRTLTSTAKIHLRNCPPTRALTGGAGTVDTY